MDKLRIEGGRPLEGEVRISGSKNAALPAMAAALLTAEPVTLHNIPAVRDINTMAKLLAHMQADVAMAPLPERSVTIQARNIRHGEAPYELVKTMRASVLTLGPLLARTGFARVSLPGGCAIGARPVDLHIAALARMGADISLEHGYVDARARRLHGAEINFDRITVTGTENIMAAATLAEGETMLRNAAREPEVVDLAELLLAMGADIEGAGTSTIRICGRKELHGAAHTVIADRIEAGTFLIAGAITRGNLLLTHCQPQHLTCVLDQLRASGISVNPVGESSLRVSRSGPILPCQIITEEYPGFPTDMQAQFMALATQAEGSSTILETIFENRFLHASEMVRLGANITVDGRLATVCGPSALSGATVLASDLRASASLVLAGLVASNTTWVERVYHIDRGYERIEEKLKSVGAQIERIS